MHNVYTTEGFILKSINFGEANKYFLIFTKDFGLIKATAQGARLLKSKLRYSLEDYSFSQISVVRGRDIWRLTSAQSKFSAKKFLKEDKNKFLLLSRIFSLLLRLLQGEERNDLLFENIKEAVNFMGDIQVIELENFECILALRILSSLGYIGKFEEFAQFTKSSYFTPELLLSMSTFRQRAISEINKSLQETHL